MAKHSRTGRHAADDGNAFMNAFETLSSIPSVFGRTTSRHAAPSRASTAINGVKRKTLPFILSAGFIASTGLATVMINANNDDIAYSNSRQSSDITRNTGVSTAASRNEAREPLANKTDTGIASNVNNRFMKESNKDEKSVTVSSDESWGGIEHLDVPQTKSAAELKLERINARNADKQALIDKALKDNPKSPVWLGVNGVPLTLDNDEVMTSYAAATNKPAGFNPNHGTGDDAGNAYPWSQCTWWAYKRRHDLGLPAGSHFGDGRMWYDSANSYGYWTSIGSPMVGDVISFPAGSYGSDGYYGHVAIVEYVGNDGSIITSESGASYNGQYFSRIFTAEMVKDMRFIHI